MQIMMRTAALFAELENLQGDCITITPEEASDGGMGIGVSISEMIEISGRDHDNPI